MTCVHRWSVRVLLALLLVFVSRTHAQCQSGWLDAPDIPGRWLWHQRHRPRRRLMDPKRDTTAPGCCGFFTTVGGGNCCQQHRSLGRRHLAAYGQRHDRGAGVLALAVFNNQLIAAGTFTSAGGVANNIARWTGSARQISRRSLPPQAWSTSPLCASTTASSTPAAASAAPGASPSRAWPAGTALPGLPPPPAQARRPKPSS